MHVSEHCLSCLLLGEATQVRTRLRSSSQRLSAGKSLETCMCDSVHRLRTLNVVSVGNVSRCIFVLRLSWSRSTGAENPAHLRGFALNEMLCTLRISTVLPECSDCNLKEGVVRSIPRSQKHHHTHPNRADTTMDDCLHGGPVNGLVM